MRKIFLTISSGLALVFAASTGAFASMPVLKSPDDELSLDLLLKCKTGLGKVFKKGGRIETMSEQDIFVEIKVFDLAKPFRTEGAVPFTITQRAVVSIDAEGGYYYVSDMHSYVRYPGKGRLTLIDDEEFSFTNSKPDLSEGSWNITISRTTGLLSVMASNTHEWVDIIQYEGECQKTVKKRLF